MSSAHRSAASKASYQSHELFVVGVRAHRLEDVLDGARVHDGERVLRVIGHAVEARRRRSNHIGLQSESDLSQCGGTVKRLSYVALGGFDDVGQAVDNTVFDEAINVFGVSAQQIIA